MWAFDSFSFSIDQPNKGRFISRILLQWWRMVTISKSVKLFYVKRYLSHKTQKTLINGYCYKEADSKLIQASLKRIISSLLSECTQRPDDYIWGMQKGRVESQRMAWASPVTSFVGPSAKWKYGALCPQIKNAQDGDNRGRLLADSTSYSWSWLRELTVNSRGFRFLPRLRRNEGGAKINYPHSQI